MELTTRYTQEHLASATAASVEKGVETGAETDTEGEKTDAIHPDPSNTSSQVATAGPAGQAPLEPGSEGETR